VLIVACPCALALAAPFTLGTAQRLLARMQVFVKNALVIERMAQVEAIVFDKTGTLTAGAEEAVRFHGKSEVRSPKSEGRRHGRARGVGRGASLASRATQATRLAPSISLWLLAGSLAFGLRLSACGLSPLGPGPGRR
jgi:magnesium-transporting ATPase (P-type)